jgi:ADP-heptose:LPS heptosyltransferase
VVEPAYAPVLGLNPDVDETFVLPRRAREWPAFLGKLRRARFTHVFDLDNNDRTAFLSRLTGAPSRTVLWHEGTAARWRSLYTDEVQDPPQRHESRSIVDYYLAALAPAGVPVASREVRLVPRPDDVAAAQRLLGTNAQSGIRNPQSKILLHPGSRSPWRIWPAENFAAVCDRVQDELDAQVFVIAGPGEQALVKEIRQHAKSHLVAIHTALSIPQFAALAAQFDAMLCHDSGPMHLAAAMGVPVVALLGSQNPVLFAPVGVGHTVLQPSLPCTACVAPDQCVPHDSYHNFCVRRIEPATVFEAIRKTLAR